MVQPGTTILRMAGHDYFVFPGVRNAVHRAFGRRDAVSIDTPSCWEVRIG